MKIWEVLNPYEIKLIEENAPLLSKQIKVKTIKSALRYSDYTVYTGALKCEYPFIIGRDAMGIVSEVTSDVPFKRGDRVFINGCNNCGLCDNCNLKKEYICDNLKIAGYNDTGMMANFLNISFDKAVLLPEQISNDEAIFIGEIAMAINIFNRLKTKKGDYIIITKASILGLILAQICIYYQTVPIILDKNEDNLQKAKELNVYYTINSSIEGYNSKIIEITGGTMAEHVVYLGGMDIEYCFDFVLCGGNIAIASWLSKPFEANANMFRILEKQLNVFGINNGGICTEAAINILVKKAIIVESLISERIKFEDIDNQIENLQDKRGSMMLVDFE